MKKPNLFIVGAPRSGTTTLYTLLSTHPDITFSKYKEPHYFLTIPVPEIERKIHHMTDDEETYLSYFNWGAKTKYYCDGSTHYLSDLEVAAKIYAYNPDSKIIIVLRDPVERAYSHFLLGARRGKDVQEFSDLSLSFMQKPYNPETLFENFVAMGSYYQQVKRYLDIFTEDAVKLIQFSQLESDISRVLLEVEEFLSIEPIDYKLDGAQNSFSQPKNAIYSNLLKNRKLADLALAVFPRVLVRKVRRLMLKEAPKPEMDPGIRQKLESYYADDRAKLEKLLGYQINY